MPRISTVILDLEHHSASVLLENEEEHINILERKIIPTEREDMYFTH